MTKVSYVITLYNKQDYVRPVLDSVLAQTGKFDQEIILVNDGSTDQTLDFIEEYAAQYPTIKILTINNSGPAIATNTGIYAATGDYIKFVDGDDVLCPNSTELLLEALTSTGFGLAHSLIQQVNVSSPTYQTPTSAIEEYSLVKNSNPLDTMIDMARFNLSCVLVRSEIVKEAGGCDDRFFIQDYSICLRIARLTNFVQVPIVLAYAPDEANNRVSDFGAGGQVLHDLNMALGYLAADYPDLPLWARKKLLRRATSRSWRWAKRQEKKNYLSKEFMNYMLSKTGLNTAYADKVIFESCETFRRTSSIRFPKHIDARSK